MPAILDYYKLCSKWNFDKANYISEIGVTFVYNDITYSILIGYHSGPLLGVPDSAEQAGTK